MLRRGTPCSNEKNVLFLSQSNLPSEAVRRLLFNFHRLIFKDFSDVSLENLRVDMRRAGAYRMTKAFALALEDTAEALTIPIVSRHYRSSFTRNYRALMPVDRRMYRVDVLEAGQEGHTAMWVNGQRYTHSDEVITASSIFRQQWFGLLKRLRKVQSMLDTSLIKETRCFQCSTLADARLSEGPCQFCAVDWASHLATALLRFDRVWTDFECAYINELIVIERSARLPIMRCIHLDNELQDYEKLLTHLLTADECSRKNKNSAIGKALDEVCALISTTFESLTTSLASLNAIANSQRKGRDDYEPAQLIRAMLLVGEYERRGFEVRSPRKETPTMELFWVNRLRGEELEWIRGLSDHDIGCLYPIAFPLVNQISSFRAHLKQLDESPDAIDPHLSQNTAIVNHLAEIEARWEAAKLWLKNEKIAKSISQFLTFVFEIADADQTISQRNNKRLKSDTPSKVGVETGVEHEETFEDRIATLDVGAVLAFPRLITLFYISNPSAFSYGQHLMSLLIPEAVIIPEAQENMNSLKRSSFVRSWLTEADERTKGDSTLLRGVQFFKRMQALYMEKKNIPALFLKIISVGVRIGISCETSRKGHRKEDRLPDDFEEQVFQHILERCITGDASSTRTQLPSIRGLKVNVDAFCNAVEEVSITLQRTHPQDWNSFLQIIIQCLQTMHASRILQGSTIQKVSRVSVACKAPTPRPTARAPKVAVMAPSRPAEAVLKGSPIVSAQRIRRLGRGRISRGMPSNRPRENQRNGNAPSCL